jgi:glycosyltransferase involved in cell wall biosynthesis
MKQRKEVSMKLSLILATKGRPQQAKACIERMFSTTKLPFELLIMSYPDEEAKELFSTLPKDKNIVLEYLDCRSVPAYNRGASLAKGTHLFAVDDDSWFPENWLENIEAAIREMPNQYGYLKIKSDSNNYWAERAVGSRNFLVDHLGGVLCIPHYYSQYEDVEKSDRAIAAGHFHVVDNVYIEHRHPAYGKADMDATYQDGFAKYAGIDQVTYQLRKQAGFPNDYESVISRL